MDLDNDVTHATRACKYRVSMRRTDCSLQRRFPIDDVLFRSGDNRDQVAKLSEFGSKFRRFWEGKSAKFLLKNLINSGHRRTRVIIW